MNMIREEVTLLDGTIEVREYPELQRPIGDVKAIKLSALANRRWQATQFFQFDGVKAPADSAMTAITATAVAINLGLRDPTETIIWKLADGEFRQWLLSDLLTYANAVQTHIQACFNHEALLSGLIQSADSADDVEAISIEAGWPS
ncbi:hypothetical protein [Aquidulcibacter sp.]|uniref:DUF4376 domain-containing protein n=1 Tax=Aquidulcibacter sp. TaxID=2052990 RepID=UPI0025BF5BE7|nr:hypothetical protein [Aquidulcibacter sp.]MCA3696247.1 hypothetical protein [Aquidulcibacter sp.]